MIAVKACLVMAALVALSSSGAAAQESEPVERYLFVGNSFTSWAGGVHTYFAGLVASEDEPSTIEVDEQTIDGSTLEEQLAYAPDVIEGGDYSVVVLQGDIPWRKTSVDPFLDAARELDAVIAESGGRTVFYMTWPYASEDWIDLDGIVEAHRRIGEELDASVAPVGIAMVNALEERPDLAMIGDDEEHQTIHGAYLAAATIYATILERSPEGLPFVAPGVTEEEAAFLQRIAWETVQEWRANPEADQADA